MADTETGLKFWAVLFVQGTEGSGAVTITDGNRSPHTEETVRKIIEIRYGAVDRMSAVGPFATSELAHKYLYDATSTPEGLNYWNDQCK